MTDDGTAVAETAETITVSFDSMSSELLDLSVQVEQAHSEVDAVLDELSDAQSVLRSAALRKLMRRLEAVSGMMDAASDAIGEAMASNVALQEAYDGPPTEPESEACSEDVEGSCQS